MIRILILAAAVFGYLYYQKEQKSLDFKRKTVHQREISSSNDPCFEKEFCFQVYVAPWCPSCHSLMPHIVAFIQKVEKSKTIGAKVYVGQEREPGGNLEMAKNFGKSAVVDQDGSVHARLNIQQYPTFYLLDGKGNTLKENQEAVNWMVEQTRK